MRVKCKRDGLLMACQLVGAATAGRTTNPILNDVKAVADTDMMTLVATDTEVGIRYELRGVEVEEAGEALFPAADLIAILRETPDEEIAISVEDDKCHFAAASGDFTVPGRDPGEFPDFALFEGASYQELTAGGLRDMVRKTIFAVDKEGDKRYNIGGVLWEVGEKTVRLVATDTRRLAVCEGEAHFQGESLAGQSFLIPTKAMDLLERNLNDDGETVRVSPRPNDILMQTEKATIYSRLLEGRYPPYRDVMPKQAEVTVTLPTERFLAAVRQAAVMTDRDSVRVTFTFYDNQVTLKAESATKGNSNITVPIEYNHEGVEIHFDPQYVIDMLRRLDDDAEVRLDLVDGSRPATFRIGENYTYLVMPLT